MSRGRGRRFEEPKLNTKKVFAVILGGEKYAGTSFGTQGQDP